MVRSAVLTYDGTRLHSGGAHVIRAKSAEAGGSALENFRLRCTDALAPDLVRVDLRNSEEHRKFVASAHDACVERFGQPIADFGRRPGGTSNWFLDAANFVPALRLVDLLQPIPVEVPFGILAVTYKISFRFLHPTSRATMPFQQQEDYLNREGDYYRYLGSTYLEAVFSDRHAVSVFFSLPFATWNEEVATFVRSIQNELPFRISERRWKRWHLNKQGTNYVGRRIAVSWEAATT
jgi:hypothetical protein